MQNFKQNFLVNFWHTGKAMIILTIIATAYYGLMRSGWAVTGEMTKWGGEFLELFGADLSGYSYYKLTAHRLLEKPELCLSVCLSVHL